MTLDKLKFATTKRLRAANVDSPDLDARLLVMNALGWDASDLILRGHEEVAKDVLQTLEGHIARRLSGEPIDHILGYREFYGRRFNVTKDVLSPRPETEGLIDLSLSVISHIPAPQILDLGTGSGAIIISILAENSRAMGVATDISDSALKIAKRNAKAHNIEDRLSFYSSDWFDNISSQYDIIISNPPYITDAAMTELSQEVKNFDPDIALRGGSDGLAPYRHIISAAKQYLKPHGFLMFEIGYDQGRAVLALMQQSGFQNITLEKDLSGHDRIVTGQNN